MAKAFFYLRKATSKKSEIIYLGLRYGQEQLVVGTGIKVLPKHWDSNKCEVKTSVGFPQVTLPKNLLTGANGQDVATFTNNYLNSLKSFVDERLHLSKDIMKSEIISYLNGKSEVEQFATDINDFMSTLIVESKKENRLISKDELVQALFNYLTPEDDKVNLFDFIETFIQDSENGKRLVDGIRINKATTIVYRTTQKVLIEFNEDNEYNLDFDVVDMKFYNEYISYMSNEKGYAPSTMGKHIKTLKTFLHEATEHGTNKNLAYQSKGFKTITSVADEIALSEHEVSELHDLDLFDNLKLDKVRDMFMIGANTGLRFSDLVKLDADNVKKSGTGFNLEIIATKGKARKKEKSKVIIPMNQVVMGIFYKYNSGFPPPISNQNYNEYLKEVAQLAPSLHETYTRLNPHGKEEVLPRWDLISAHSSRRTFATNQYKKGVPIKSIMSMMGQSDEKVFWGYVKVSKNEHAEIMRNHQ